MSEAAKIVAILVARPGRADELKALLFSLIEPCRAEPGNLRWDVWQDEAQTDRFVLDELYIDRDAVIAHRSTPHVKDYLAKINDLADRTSYVLSPVDIS
mgnify:CR=1 FL=1